MTFVALDRIPARLSCKELSNIRASRNIAIIDVREDWEWAISRINGAQNIPLRQIPGRVAEIPRDRHVVVVCQHGMRSAQASAWLQTNGFENVSNLEGGIDAWSREIDPSVARY